MNRKGQPIKEDVKDIGRAFKGGGKAIGNIFKKGAEAVGKAIDEANDDGKSGKK